MTSELRCAFCSENLDVLTIAQRQDHYEAHFIQSTPTAEPSSQRAPRGPKPKTRFHPTPRAQWNSFMNKAGHDVFWYPALNTPPPQNYTPGLVSILKNSLTTLCAQNKISRAVLCHEKVVHISKTLWDASWGCGYRNFLILCTGLREQQEQPLYSPLLDTYPQPGVHNLQVWIQHAWDNGYDQIGCLELKNKIIGTNKWIGTADIYIALCHRRIPAELLDFSGFKDKESCAAAVIEWVVGYFIPQVSDQSNSNINDVLGKTSPVAVTKLMPVILQHRGHSRVIVGYQRDVDGNVHLLTFDTGRLIPLALRNSARSSFHPQDEEQAMNIDSDKSGLSPDAPTSSGEALKMTNEKAKAKIASYFKVGRHHKQGSKPEPTTGIESVSHKQVQRVFKLTAKQLASQLEYQVLYVPLRAPLSDAEVEDKKVVKCRRITSQSIASTSS